MDNVEFVKDKAINAAFALFELRNALRDYDTKERADDIEEMRKKVESIILTLV